MIELSPLLILIVIASYFILLVVIAHRTSGDGDHDTFFLANRSSPWLLVAIGMIGASLSGVTFISLPGAVGKGGLNQQYAYMQMVMGYLFGYLVIAHVLLPIYYKYQLTTIYQFLGNRIGIGAHKTGSAFFILSRLAGASMRLYIVASVLQVMLMDAWGIPFVVTIAITIGLIWVYTYKGGIKTIVVTDTIQTMVMIGAVTATVAYLCHAMDIGLWDLPAAIQSSGLNQLFFYDHGWSDPNFFFKQFVSGALITIVMTGLDQDMMQKNLTCRTLKEAQKNIYLFSIILVFANLLFITLGAMMYMYLDHQGIAAPLVSDELYPMLALHHLPGIIGLLFLIGLMAAAYSSADSALTSMTTVFCVDFLGLQSRTDLTQAQSKALRFKVHIGFSVLLALIILIVRAFSSGTIINDLFMAAGYTYGPVLALFCFAMWIRRKLSPIPIVLVCLIAPILTYFIDQRADVLLGGFQLGFLVLLLNALIAFVGLCLTSVIFNPYHKDIINNSK